MEFPQIPTDNLYKFLSLFGMVIVAGAIVCPLYLDHQFQLKAIQAQAEVDTVQARINKIYALEQAHAPELDYLEQTRQFGDLQVEQAQAEGKRKEADFLITQSQRMLHWSKWGVIIGVFTSILGFSLWYLNLQRWQDRSHRASAQDKPPSP